MNWKLRESMAIPGLIHAVEDQQGRTIKLNGFALSGSDEASRNTRDVLKAMELHGEMLEALHEARLQIEYLHEKFQVTGTGETVLARIRSVIARAEAK